MGWKFDRLNQRKVSTNIPPIKIISCVNESCYLIDFEGNLWSFGNNDNGQLGLGDTTRRSSPVQLSGVWTDFVIAKPNAQLTVEIVEIPNDRPWV